MKKKTKQLLRTLRHDIEAASRKLAMCPDRVVYPGFHSELTVSAINLLMAMRDIERAREAVCRLMIEAADDAPDERAESVAVGSAP
jgi:hypothetical protein